MRKHRHGPLTDTLHPPSPRHRFALIHESGEDERFAGDKLGYRS